jgi:hypothetical protein
MKAHFTHFALTFAAAAILIFVAAAPATAATQTFRGQENFSVFVPCANGGLGEDVDGILKGLEVFGITEDGAGGFHVHVHLTFHGVGIGADTGDKYQMHVDVEDAPFEILNVTAGGSQSVSITLSADVIGMGDASNFHADLRGKFTVNANGVVTVDRFEFADTCN